MINKMSFYISIELKEKYFILIKINLANLSGVLNCIIRKGTWT